ncbi:MAG: AraC family transcriptional regulator ligand-binding domain-containing protein [Acidimicrobiales bacterium]
MATGSYALDPASRALLIDLGISPANVLRRASLPADLFARGPVSLSEQEFFAFWHAVEGEAGDPNLPIRIAEIISPEVFEPALFAALVSPNLNVAAQRVARFKKLIGPMELRVDIEPDVTTLAFVWPDGIGPPPALVLTELLFWVALTRIGTRHRVEPLRVTAPDSPADVEAYRGYLGVEVQRRGVQTVTFSAGDAARPFLMASDAMWETFEPALRKRLSDLENGATDAERVRAALLELLPAGESGMDAVAAQLSISNRTLHRRLQNEGTTFQGILSETRESLARHYLTSAGLSAGEIAFLLGYEETSSFYRAFHSWTGETPERVRAAAG